MKTIAIRISYQSIHNQVCNMCAAYDWLQQVNPSDGKRYPLITPDMFMLMLPHYQKLCDNAVSVLRGWVAGVNDEQSNGRIISLNVPSHTSEHDIELMLEGYLIDATMRKYSHLGKKSAGTGSADEALYLITAMLTDDYE